MNTGEGEWSAIRVKMTGHCEVKIVLMERSLRRRQLSTGQLMVIFYGVYGTVPERLGINGRIRSSLLDIDEHSHLFSGRVLLYLSKQ